MLVHAFGYSKSFCGLDADDVPNAECLTLDFGPVTCEECLRIRNERIASGDVFYVLGASNQEVRQ